MNDNFEHRAADWDSPAKIEMTTLFAEELKKNVLLDSQMKVFEVGAGTGLVGLQFYGQVGSIIFEDTSAAMLEVLKGKIRDKENIEILHAEIDGYLKSDIDLIFSCMAFHHIPDIMRAVKQFYAMLKAGGKVVIGDLVTEDGSFHRFEPIPHKGFDLDDLKKKFESVGFKVLKLYVYHTLERERTPGIIGKYDQFILVAEKVI